MKEIKFRVFNGTTMEYSVMAGKYGAFFINPESGDGLDPKDSASITPANTKYHDTIPVMQFIGGYGYEGSYENRFNNMVELYEGDIVEAWSEGVKGTFVIKFRQETQPTFMLYPAFQGGKMWSIAFGIHNGVYYDDLKRIGNIHENPELLK